MGTCDPNLPCEKCGRTQADIDQRKREEARGGGIAGAIGAMLKGKSPVRRRKQARLLNPDSTRNAALCQTGRHDFVTFKREATKGKIREGLRLKTVWFRGPRVRVCRACGAKQAHCTTGQWITV